MALLLPQRLLPWPRDKLTDNIMAKRDHTAQSLEGGSSSCSHTKPHHSNAQSQQPTNQHPSIQAFAQVCLFVCCPRTRPSSASTRKPPRRRAIRLEEGSATCWSELRRQRQGHVAAVLLSPGENYPGPCWCPCCMAPRFARTINQTGHGKGTVARLLLRRQRTQLIEHDQSTGGSNAGRHSPWRYAETFQKYSCTWPRYIFERLLATQLPYT